VSDSRDVVSVERVIPAPPEAIFDLIADPSRHRDIDGSGSVRDAPAGSQRLEMGSSFGMHMRIGVPYSMVSTVIEFEENRVLAWQTRGPTAIGKHFAGRIWRYDLEPVDGGTRVRETWDLTHESAMTKPFARMGADAARRSMAATLERIEELVTTSGEAPS
jgi:uncharacterized protein YndB with AHSA1/START domain